MHKHVKVYTSTFYLGAKFFFKFYYNMKCIYIILIKKRFRGGAMIRFGGGG